MTVQCFPILHLHTNDIYNTIVLHRNRWGPGWLNELGRWI